MDSWNSNGGQSPAYGGAGGLNDGLPAAAEVGGEISLSHNPGLAVHWSAEEQAILEQGLTEFASEQSIVAYAKIASKLTNKTVRDVALRKRWMIRNTHQRMKDDRETSYSAASKNAKISSHEY